MKINLIIFISEFNLGGAGNSLFKLCKNLPKKKFSITVLCLNKCFYKSKLNELGIKVFEIRSDKTFFAMPKIKKIVENLIKKKQKNIFLSNIHFSNVLSVLFLRSLNIKIVLVERTPFEELFIYYNFLDFIKKNIIKILIKFTFYKADLCISNSKYISEKYNKFYNLKFKTIHAPSFKKLYFNKQKKLTKKEICFGIVSRLSREKKIEDVIQVFSKINKNIILKIVGDGPEEKKLKYLTKRLRLEKKIKFLGRHDPDKIKFTMKKFDYFINSSDFEGFPNSVVEALSVGIPVIAKQSHGGINDMIKNKNYGIIYNNYSELKTIICNIVEKKSSFKLNKKDLFIHLSNFNEVKSVSNYQKYLEKI